MATELGVAYISIVAATQNFSKEVKKALGEMERDTSAVTEGKNGFGAKLAGGAVKGLKLATGAAAGLGVAVAGIALKKGLDRALALDEATAKLTGLGHSAETVDEIMSNALASVKGTAYGLGDAGSVAASAVAAGIKPGQDLTRTLKLVGDASTISGRSMGEMGAIFNKAAASNKVQMDVINQLHDAGVPALSLLAKQMGVTAEEASAMASKGKIDFATFQNAMEAGLGGAALESGATVKGAWANMLAALGRVGEKLVSKILPHAVEFFGQVTAWADKTAPVVEAFATVVGEKLGKAFAWIKTNVLPVLGSLARTLKTNVLPAVVGLGKFVAGTLLPALGKLIGFISRNRDIFTALAVTIGAGVIAFKTWAVAVAGWQAVTKAATAVQVAFNAVLAMNPIMLVVTAIAALVAGLAYFFTQTETGRQVWASMMDGLRAGAEWISGVFSAVWGALAGTISGAWNAITSATSAAWDWVKNAVSSAVDFVVNLFLNFSLPGLIISHWNTIASATTTAWNALVAFFSAIPGKIVGFFSSIGSLFSEIFQGAVNAITNIWNSAVSFFAEIPGKIVGTFKSIGDTLSAPFKAAFNAIAKAWNNTVGKLNWEVPSWVPGIGGKKVGAPKLPLLAEGGTATADGWSIVGERGPEFLHMPRGASVVPLDHPMASNATEGSSAQLDSLLALLAQLLGRPSVVKIGEREFFEIVRGVENKFGGR